MVRKNKLDTRVVFQGDLARRLRAYLDARWPGQQVANEIIRRAVREFLDRECPGSVRRERDGE